MINYAALRRRNLRKPKPTAPRPSRATVDGSGTAATGDGSTNTLLNTDSTWSPCERVKLSVLPCDMPLIKTSDIASFLQTQTQPPTFLPERPSAVSTTHRTSPIVLPRVFSFAFPSYAQILIRTNNFHANIFLCDLLVYLFTADTAHQYNQTRSVLLFCLCSLISTRMNSPATFERQPDLSVHSRSCCSSILASRPSGPARTQGMAI